MKKVLVGVWLIVLAGISSQGRAVTDPYVKEQQLWIDLYFESDSLVYTPPEWLKPVALEDAPEDISHWLYNVLPYPEDRDENVYLVIPQLGLITPVVSIPPGSADFNNMVKGKEIPINNYLKWGIIEYVNSVSPWYRGKRVDFWHSNYYKSDNGRYKSIFANLMALDVGDEVWYYVKQPDGAYKLFKYDVMKSYPTHPSNVQALQWDGDGADALIFGCYHGLDGRRMIEATYQGTPIGWPEDVRYEPLPNSWKNKVKAAVAKISWMPRHVKAYQIVRLFKWTKNARSIISDKDPDKELKNLMLDYIEEKLALIYPE